MSQVFSDLDFSKLVFSRREFRNRVNPRRFVLERDIDQGLENSRAMGIYDGL